MIYIAASVFRETRIFNIYLLLLTAFLRVQAGDIASYTYQVDLNNILQNRFRVSLKCEDFAQDTLIYHFPWIIPGTYDEANYGNFIHDLVAYDRDGKQLAVKKKGKNTFIVSNASNIESIEYWVSATWDSRRRKTIWPMAGTGIVPGRVFAINAGGVFGYFEGRESSPVELSFIYPEDLYAMTVLDQQADGKGKVFITAVDYHELIDSPIMFGYADTSSFKVWDTDVMVGFAHETDDTRRGLEISNALQPAMIAIACYLDSLPADKYAYLIYYNDASALGKILDKPRFLLFKGLWYVLRHGLPMGGALEHNNSSFYYLPDPGPGYTESINEVIGDISIHEFMHIITPLNLRSQYIHEWDYDEPIFSKHLWLYEGVTEYMAEIIQVNGGLKSPKEFLLGTMRSKLRIGEKFPLKKMSFTEMSTHVLERPYKKQYIQVYQRGAVIGMLLDIEIIRLTGGEKRLIDVMLELVSEYGPDRPFAEDSLFQIFTDKVHPDLMNFFISFVEGRKPLPYAEILNHVGVEYLAESEIKHPKDPLKDNAIKQSPISIGGKRTISKTGRKERLGLQAGDKLPRHVYLDLYFDDFGKALPEGMSVAIPVERGGQEITITDIISYKQDDREHSLRILDQMTPEQSRYFNIWLGFEAPGPLVLPAAIGQD
ncbi:MAG: hypothetical protein HQ508_03410 [Candidatus Marinimicrobia bacterium]|nr:hypothetical protein [Candidatus Neomarinimicrobiota bacterium]